MMLARTALAARTAAASRVVSRRQMSSEARIHTAKSKWSELQKTRPPKDHNDEHLCFHPPYNGPVMGVAIFVSWCVGYGVIGFGAYHQQRKQGYIK
mmetsp:Transcript_16185/g.45300  ORF Transcript_16185/g.45300 Transcript_16185/m.45300 type:complete len:96 (-) Transcript_16185:236-523(-)|eukprot:CAMPEP_0119556692 /NCGR_PEP_ID=MMETSP1352-20130426/8570_1 /TAXON_ID=265584 /ORGANISM="Stauroneis constricta, Strain CCMP1120" /LENGTH=95 /DNA_ID=CAMNT_0007603679 /DNA_START=67 /DNA_END=354 /DNA_ORIENTATION=+